MSAAAPTPYLVRPPDLQRADDATLARAAAERDPRAYDVIWDRYAPQLRGLLRRSTGQDGVDDLLQDVFVRFIQSVTTLRDTTALRSFLFGIAVHVAMSELRRRRVRRWVTLFQSESPPESPAPGRDDDAREAVSRLYRLLDRVDPQSRMLFTLRHIEGLELKDVASTLGVSLATAKRRITRADARVHELALHDERLVEYLKGRLSKGGRDGN